MSQRHSLSERQSRFVDVYAACGDATQAAIQAGYAEKTAKGRSAKLLAMPTVIAALAGDTLQPRGGQPVTAERIIAEYTRIAFSDLREFIAWGPKGVKFRSSAQLTDDQARCVAEVAETVTQHGGSRKFKLHDKKGALDSLVRCMGPFVERREHTGREGEAIEMSAEPDLSRLSTVELRTLETLLSKAVRANGEASDSEQPQSGTKRANMPKA